MTTHEHDSDLDDAFRAVRDRFDGAHPEADATLRRALLATRKNARARRVRYLVIVPLAAALAASTAWAGATGRLVPVFHSVVDTFRGQHAEATAPSPASTAPAPLAAAAPAPPPSVDSATPPIREAAPPPLVAVASGSNANHAPPAPSAPSAPSAPAAVASAADPNAALFAEAHRLHFTERDPARALAAWDRYLAAAPRGKFAREARYNRALALVRVGRHAEAKAELEAFANGTYDDYRRADARALLDALARDE
jgi:hypothetical protein